MYNIKTYIKQLFISDYYVEIFKYIKMTFRKYIEYKRVKKIINM